MSKRNKIICIILVIIFIAAIIVTGVKGLNVDINYAEGTSIVFDIGKQFELSDIENMVDDIWEGDSSVVQKVEIYDESVLIKLRNFTDEQLDNLANKLNEKYDLGFTRNDFTILYNSNLKLREVIKPYVIPLIITTALIVVYYSIRYRGVKEILELLLTLIASEGIIYSIYALLRLPVNIWTMPIAMIVYAGAIIYVTIKHEDAFKNKKHIDKSKVQEEKASKNVENENV